MRRYIWIVALLMCCGDFYGQGKVSKKDMNRAAEVNKTVVIDSLKKRIDSLTVQYDRLKELLRKLETRSFNPTLSDAQLEKYLGAMSLEDIYHRRNEVREQLALAEEGSKWAPVYKEILDIRDRLGQLYNKETNKRDKETLDNPDFQPLENHKSSFEELRTAVNDYRFVMFELVRVKNIVDNMVKDTRDAEKIRSQLKKDNELVFIEEVPFASTTIRNYIEYKTKREDEKLGNLVGDLQKACPEAFE